MSIVCTREQLELLPLDSHTDFAKLNQELEHCPLSDFLQWSLNTFGDKIAQVTSFGTTGIVLLDHLAKLAPGIKVITIDTHFLFEETYALRETIQRRYPIQLEIRKPTLSPTRQADIYEPKLWEHNPDMCCYLRKVVPIQPVFAELDAWFTGLRRDQSPTRAHLPRIQWDDKYQLVKINPLAMWTRGEIWHYILEHDLPYNPLHDKGYASIGCTHCTRPSSNMDDERSGRWVGHHEKVECGLHIKQSANIDLNPIIPLHEKRVG